VLGPHTSSNDSPLVCPPIHHIEAIRLALPLTDSCPAHPIGDATLRSAISLLPLFSLPFTVADGAGRLPPRRSPARRGGVVYPLAVSRRGGWYQRQNHTSTV